jgi:hypothetical protein
MLWNVEIREATENSEMTKIKLPVGEALLGSDAKIGFRW